MQVQFEWNNGLIFGLAQDEIWCVENPEDSPNFDNEPDSMIVLYLGLFNITFVFENDDGDGGPPLKDKPA
jgi:hypothetical protein